MCTHNARCYLKSIVPDHSYKCFYQAALISITLQNIPNAPFLRDFLLIITYEFQIFLFLDGED